MLRKTLIIALLLSVIAGCGDSPEHRMYMATIALRNGLPDQALDLVNGVLAERPNDENAILIKAQAQIQLQHFDEGKKTLDQMIASDPNSIKAHSMQVTWATEKMKTLLQNSDFGANRSLSEDFDSTMAEGQKEAEWIGAHAKKVGESQFHHGMFALVDAGRYAKLIGELQSSLKTVTLDGDEPSVHLPKLAAFKRKRDGRLKDAQDHFHAAVEANPEHHEAASQYASLLTGGRKWTELWKLSKKLADQKQLPPSLVENLVLSLLTMPDDVMPPDERVGIGWKLANMVEEKKRKSLDWQLTSARLHMMTKEYEKAQPILEEVLTKKPNDLTGRFLLAQCLFNQSAFAQAKAILDKLSTEARGSSQIQSLYGRALIKTGDTFLAMEPLRRAVELNPADAIARQALVGLMAQDKDAASRDIEEFYSKNPGDPRAITMKLQYERYRNNKSAVAEVLGRTSKLDPLLDDHFRILVDGYMYLEQYEQMENFARDLLGRRPNSIDAHMSLALALMMREKEDECQKLLVEVKQKFPDSPGMEQMLGRLYVRRRAFAKASPILTKGVESDPKNVQSRLLLATSLAGEFKFSDATKHIEKAIEINPRSVPAHELAWRVYSVIGQTAKANKYLIQIDPSDVSEHTNPSLLATIKFLQNDIDEAVAIANRALSRGVNDPTLHDLLAKVYSKKKDYVRAENHLVSLIKLQAKNVAAWQRLVNFIVGTKRFTTGVSLLEQLRGVDEVYARIAQADLLLKMGQRDQALTMVKQIYGPIIAQKDERALMIAEVLARIHLAGKDAEGAKSVYDSLIKADVNVIESKLRQIDLMSKNDGQEKTIAKLDALADTVKLDHRTMLVALMNRYLIFRRPDRALRLLDRMIVNKPKDPRLHQTKGQILARLSRPVDAAKSLQDAISLSSDDIGLRMQIVQIYLNDHNYPAAEAALENAAKIDEGAKIIATSALGQMYVQLGLNKPATEIYVDLEKMGKPNDPGVQFSMGSAYMALAKNDKALTRLGDIPSYAPQYSTAQVRMAQIEQRSGKNDEAKERLQKLLRSPQHVRPTAIELMKLDMSKTGDRDLIVAGDESLSLELLPPQLRARWLRIRINIDSKKKDWRAVQQSLEQAVALEPKSVPMIAARVVTSIRLKKREEARHIYKSSPDLAKTPNGRLLAVLLKEEPDKEARRVPICDYFEAMINGNLAAARSATARLPGYHTIYRTDLRATTERSDAQSPEISTAFWNLAVAFVALESGMPYLCSDISQSVSLLQPRLSMAHSLRVAALFGSNGNLEESYDAIKKSVPNTGLAMYMKARDLAKNGKTDEANKVAAELLKREPDNDHIRYQMAQLNLLMDQVDLAITRLEALWSVPGPFQGAAGNDLAYLLCEYKPDRLDEAYLIAGKVLQHAPTNPPLQDTVGWIEFHRGNRNVAMKHINRAVVKLNFLSEVHYHLGAVYHSFKNTRWARYHLERAVEGPADKEYVKKAKELLGQL